MRFTTKTAECGNLSAGSSRTALVAEAKEHDREAACDCLQQHGFEVAVVNSGKAAVALIVRNSFTLALVDSALKDLTGLQVLERIRDLRPQSDVILTSSRPDIDEAVDAIRLGAIDYMTKPVDPERLKFCIGHLSDQDTRRHARGPNRDADATMDKSFLTCNPGVLQLLEAASMVAGSRATILITGESGTGKEVLAAYIHQAAGQPERPFVAVNCAALPETLIESELFGHEKGAFTGAAQSKAGKFEQVGAGTLVLDEIGDMPLTLQPKILRILQERRIERLGGATDRSFEGQVIAITNQDLEAAVKDGRFREDLYYRINVVPFHLPPLRARRDDIPLLAGHFINKYARLYGKTFEAVSPRVMARMRAEEWKGNVRELENRIERSVLM
nr:sigma-54-dependent Fis family transcriptional regulator [Desulfobacterales bacterium]